MEKEYIEWCNTRPDHVKIVALKFKPWERYRIKETGQECSIRSFDEQDDGIVKISVIVHHFTGMDYGVFGYSPEDLEQISLHY